MTKQPRHPQTPIPQPKHIVVVKVKKHPPKLGLHLDLYHSRPLRSKEKDALLGLLQPEHDDETRCAAAQVILRLGIEEAVPAMKDMRAAAPLIVQSVFDLAMRFMTRMKSRSDIPLPEEQLGVLMMMRNSEKSIDRHYADIVLQKARIMYGTPLIQPDLDHPRARGMYETSPSQLLGDLDYAFRADVVKADNLPEHIRKQMGLEPKKR